MYLIDPEGTLVYQDAINRIKSTNPGGVADATNYAKEAYMGHLLASRLPRHKQILRATA